MKTRHILLMIAAILALTIGSFIWFIATWDASKEEPIGQHMPVLIERATV